MYRVCVCVLLWLLQLSALYPTLNATTTAYRPINLARFAGRAVGGGGSANQRGGRSYKTPANICHVVCSMTAPRVNLLSVSLHPSAVYRQQRGGGRVNYIHGACSRTMHTPNNGLEGGGEGVAIPRSCQCKHMMVWRVFGWVVAWGPCFTGLPLTRSPLPVLPFV